MKFSKKIKKRILNQTINETMENFSRYLNDNCKTVARMMNKTGFLAHISSLNDQYFLKINIEETLGGMVYVETYPGIKVPDFANSEVLSLMNQENQRTKTGKLCVSDSGEVFCQVETLMLEDTPLPASVLQRMIEISIGYFIFNADEINRIVSKGETDCNHDRSFPVMDQNDQEEPHVPYDGPSVLPSSEMVLDNEKKDFSFPCDMILPSAKMVLGNDKDIDDDMRWEPAPLLSPEEWFSENLSKITFREE